MDGKRILMAAATSALLLAPGTAPASPGGGTHVDSVSATVGSSTLAVSGTATFVDTPGVVATDASGDAVPAMLGTDLTSGTISRDPATNNLVFSVGIADEVPGAFGVPEVMHYGWAFGVGEDGSGGYWLLQAVRTAQAVQAGADPMFRLMQFRADGTCCDPRAALTGTMALGKVTWTVAMSRISATTGTLLTPHPARPVQVQIGASAQQWLNSGQPDQMFYEDTYAIPGITVQLGVAPAGTPLDQVNLTVNANVTQSTGAFSGAVPKPASPGSYVVVAKACFVAGVCGMGSTTITI